MTKSKASHYRSRRTKRKRGGALSIVEDRPVVATQPTSTHIAPRLPHDEDLANLTQIDPNMSTAHRLLNGVAGVSMDNLSGVPTPQWLGHVSYNTPVLPRVQHFQHHEPVDLMSMAHEINASHFREYLPVDPYHHAGQGKYMGGSLWSSIAGTAETAFEGVGATVGGIGLAISPIMPEIGLPLAAAGGVTTAVGAGFGALKKLGGGLDRGDLFALGGGLAGDIGSGMKDVGSFIKGSGYDIASGVSDAAGFVGLQAASNAIKGVGKVPFEVSGGLLQAAGTGLSALDKLFG